MERLGVGVLSPAQGLAALATVFAQFQSSTTSAPVVAANPFSWVRFSSIIQPLPHLFRSLGIIAQSPRESRSAARAKLSSGDPALEPRVFEGVKKQVSDAIASVLGRKIDPNEPLMDAGLDSLAMTEVAAAITSVVGMKLPQTVAFDYPTVVAIAGYVVSESTNHLEGMRPDHTVSVVQQQVSDTITAVIGRRLEPNEPLMDAGLDSLTMTEVASALSSAIGVQVPQTVAFDYPCISAIAGYICSQQRETSAEPVKQERKWLNESADKATAIVGMGVRLPRTVTDCASLWDMVITGADRIDLVPEGRWDVDLSMSSGIIHRRRDPQIESYSRHGSFVDGIELFDNTYFGVSAKDAAEMDPQQRVLIQVCAEALHLGGLDRSGMRGTNTAVIIGICNNDFDTVLRQETVGLMISGNKSNVIADKVGRIAYSTYAFAANRVSHTLALVGPSLSVDTASASALVATHMAAMEARRLSVGVRALSGGVNLILHPALTDLHTARNMFPKDGRCKTFDASADGFERGEGSVAICQRPLVEATEATDLVLAVVRGSTTIHKGGGASLRAMRGPAIQQKVHAALSDAGLTPNDIRYLEASGMGEPYGDAVEVGAYQALFQPGRCSQIDGPLIFGSIHTNIGHLDGASGIAAFAKTVMVVQQLSVPPVVHFRQLHPLVTGRKSGVDQATKMGHTYNQDVNVAGFPALFPMAASSIAAPLRSRSCPAGTSAFGFGGSMAHVIVDGQPEATRDAVRTPLKYKAEIRFPWKFETATLQAKLQETGDVVISYLESVISTAVGSELGISDVPRAADVFTRLSPHAITRVCVDLRERLGCDWLDEPAFSEHSSCSKLASAVLHRSMLGRATSGFSIQAIVRDYMALQVSRQIVDPRRSVVTKSKTTSRMVFVLAGPRSGSTLLQLVLNAHSQLYAGQELYLLPFHTMAERRERLDRPELRGWVFEGLRKTVSELRGCSISEADDIITSFNSLTTADVFSILQTWAGARGQVLVDKTPPYCWSPDTLRRADELFENAQYIHIHRHPYANIASMCAEAVQREWVESVAGERLPPGWRADLNRALWDESEALWAQGNANVLDFFCTIAPERCCRVAYEELLTMPSESCHRLCRFLQIPFEATMTQPYTPRNLITFEPAVEGGLGASDPKLRTNARIEARMADAWQQAPIPRPLTTFAAHVAIGLGYRLLHWKEPTLRSGAPLGLVRLNSCTISSDAFPPLVMLHGVSGTLTRLEDLGRKLPFPVFGLYMAREALSTLAAGGVDALAAMYESSLDCLQLPSGAHLAVVADDAFGVILAQTMAEQMSQKGKVSSTVLMLGGSGLSSSCTSKFLSTLESGTVNSAYTAAIWELALEACALGEQSPPQRDAFFAAIDCCGSDEEKIDLASNVLRPRNMSMVAWDTMALHLVCCSLCTQKTLFNQSINRGRSNGLLRLLHITASSPSSQLPSSDEIVAKLISRDQ